MIGDRDHYEKEALRAVFPEQCLKATPDPEFLSSLYGFKAVYFRLSPQENRDQLFSSCYKACELALTAEGDNTSIPDPDAEIGPGMSSWGSALYAMPGRLMEVIAGTFSGLTA